MKPLLIIHGGAWDIPHHLHDAHLNGIREALHIGSAVLKKTDKALQAVLESIKYLETDPVFDAGKGSFLNADGEVEMDAGIMVGSDLSAGSVAAIQNVEHPIEVAEAIRKETQHVMLVGKGATEFAHLHGFKQIATEHLLVGRERDLYFKLKKKKRVRIKSFFEEKQSRDTVGAVAIDSSGLIVAGTSTGGTPFKIPGRVGDSPIVGSGFYADSRFGGVSSTGWGEGIIRIMLARTIVDYLKSDYPVGEAANLALNDLKKDVDGRGGVIAINAKGEWAYNFNTPFMAIGIADTDHIIHASMGNN